MMAGSPLRLSIFIWLLCAMSACDRVGPDVRKDADIIIVGAGLAGLSAAIDAARNGADVLVVDMNSVFGGHGIQSGGVAVVGSPMQAEMGYEDTPDQAYRDWMEWTVDGDAEWTRFYVEHSREWIYDWVTGLGVRFDRVIPSHGNSVPRFHMTYRRGLNLTRPLYTEALRYSNIRFQWNSLAEELIKRDGRVAGIVLKELRSGRELALKSRAVILATGGFQSNIDLVKEHWPADLPAPGQIFSMSGQISRGSGLRMAEEAGAALVHLDRQYNGYAALPNVLGLDDERGFVSGSSRTIWVNSEGRRFVTETGIDRDVFPVVMQQTPPGYWRIFDEVAKGSFRINSPHFVSADAVDNDKILRYVIDNPAVTTKANTLRELAERIGLPGAELEETVRTYNALVARGESTAVNGVLPEGSPPAFQIDAPPFYAMRVYPMANKSAGGIAIDMQARALDDEGNPVPGLYAAGEVTGSAGINGLNGLDGMFTGPAILTGRVAGRSATADLVHDQDWSPTAFTRQDDIDTGSEPAIEDKPRIPDVNADELRIMLQETRDGYWHFEQVHRLVLERDYRCTQCHTQRVPFGPASTRMQQLAQTDTCDACHLAPAGMLDPTASHAAAP
ncbi:MAG: FAD-dependent oxidoreductase [Gammaproteobacteria bacterium]|nr:FAD-dependent oxidoreductase [Gammaproteobacteria bacterium]